MDFNFSLAITVVAFLFSLYYLTYIMYTRKNTHNIKKLPVAKGAWPIIGHLYLFGGSKLPHVVLGSMAEKYGPIFAIRLGSRKAMIVSDWKIAKECYLTNDKVFVDRPKAIAVEVMGYKYAVSGLGPYGPYWQKMRKITRELLSVHRIEMFENLRVSEIKKSMEDLTGFWIKNRHDQNSMVKVDMNQWIGSLTMNLVLRTIVGKRYDWNDEEGVHVVKLTKRFSELLGIFALGDFVTYLRWLDWGGYEKEMRYIAKETDCILTKWLDERKRTRKSSDELHDIMDMMLAYIDDATFQDYQGFDTDTVIKATCLAFITGAADSTKISLTWALSLLINNPHVLKKAKDELNKHVGRNKQVTDKDLDNLVYLQAVVKESMRVHPAGQIPSPRESTQDCVIGGYHIPKGTRLLVNLSKIHRDPQVWPNPDEFQPERFLTSHQNVDVKGNHYELLPFGSGRRRCAGILLGLRVVHLTLASLIHGFEFEKAYDEPDDMSSTAGLNNSKAHFVVHLKPSI